MKFKKSIERRTGPLCLIAGCCIALALLLAALAPAAGAETPKPHWTIVSFSAPTYVQPGDEGDYFEAIAVNDGAAPTDGTPITLTDSMSPELTATSADASIGYALEGTLQRPMTCPIPLSCETELFEPGELLPVPPGEEVAYKVQVSVGPNPSQLFNSVTISGGGAESATATRAVGVSASPVPFGASIAASAPAVGGDSASQSGSHPVGLTTMLDFGIAAVDKASFCTPTHHPDPGCPLLNAAARDLEIALPPGLLGNPNALPRCPQVQFQEYNNTNCPADTQVGSGRVYFYGSSGSTDQFVAVYNVEPPPGQPAELGFTVGGSFHIPIFFHLRADSDYGLSARLGYVPEALPARLAALTIWGVPADPVHDEQRAGLGCSPNEGCPSGVLEPKPFLTMPTACPGSDLPISVSGDSWQNPLFPYPVFDTTTLPGMSGCNQLEFEPTLQARPTTNLADSPSGLHVDLHVPQPESVEGLAEAHLKDATVTLPKGLTVNPASANGLDGCPAEQIGLTTEPGETPIHTTAEAANCPDASKLGTVEVDTPLLKDPLPGSVYLAQPYENPFKSLLALYITVDDPQTGVVVKLAGEVHIGPDGQLTTTVEENPQLPFTDFKLDFFGGARAPLRTPAVCGNYETTSELTPWSAPESGPPAKPSDPYEISSGPNGHPCANTEAQEPNKPSFEAGTVSPLAAAYSPFILHLHREDGSQNFSALNVTLPPGLIGKLAGVGECPDSALATAASKTGAAEQASPSCPASSRLGTVNVAAGAGPSPFNAGGVAYLAGPYKSAPLSVAIITPAVAGPFDLGTVVVRSALYVNPETAQISVKSDPIPTALQGIQLDVRSIDLNLDRKDFTLNPTNCERSAFSGEAISSLNQIALLSSPFQVGECSKLGFKPKLALKLSGKTKRTGHPALRAQLTYPKGAYANIARAQVTLPRSEFLDQAHIGTVCTRVQFAANACPAASIYGHARAITPLLDNPIEGPVYLRSSSHNLPDLVADLNGQISVDLAGKVDTGKGGGIRNTFEVVPDAPVSKFVLSMQGGKKGLLVNSENICRKPQKALAHFVAQNGKVTDTQPKVQNSCEKGAKAKKKGRSAKSGGPHR